MRAATKLGGRYAAGAACIALGWLWKLKGPRGGMLARLGPLPGINAGDLVTLPLLGAGLVCMASVPGLPWWRRLLGVAGLVSAVLWVTSELPWDDPLVPGLQFRRHGVHLLDLLAVGPALGGVVLLTPGFGRWWRGRRRDRRRESAVWSHGR